MRFSIKVHQEYSILQPPGLSYIHSIPNLLSYTSPIGLNQIRTWIVIDVNNQYLQVQRERDVYRRIQSFQEGPPRESVSKPISINICIHVCNHVLKYCKYHLLVQ
ncbi:hypothetical protein FKM82_012590 [Ascaphus truei]